MTKLASKERHALREEQQFFQEFYSQYRRLLFYCAGQYTQDPALREDLVQDALVRLLRCVPTLRTLNAARTAAYLHTTVKSAYIDHCRRNSQLLPLEGSALETLGARTDPGDYTAKWDAQILRSRLPERDWFLLEARYIMEASDETIAAALGCTPDSARVLLSRARRRAKAILADHQRKGDPR